MVPAGDTLKCYDFLCSKVHLRLKGQLDLARSKTLKQFDPSQRNNLRYHCFEPDPHAD
jgi:hypothetical protein